MKRVTVLVGAMLCVVLAAPAAQAKSFTLPEARIEAEVLPDGSVHVVEHITYSFFGSFSGGYREIPLEKVDEATGDTTLLSISDIAVSENGAPYSPGASAELGSSGAPGTFGVADLGRETRIVWHYDATDEQRTFEVEYTLRGLAVAYDDVVDVNLRVWGDEWDQELSVLSATMKWPGAAPGETLIWGHPADISGVVELKENGKGATLSAANIPPGRWVEMRGVFPRSLLSSTSAATVVAGPGRQLIVEQEGDLARRAEEDRRRLESLKRSLPWMIPLGLISLVLPALVIGFLIWRRFGREPKVGPVPQYLHEPPGEEDPALVTALLSEGHSRATGEAFTATLFDLIRRGHIDAFQATTVKKTWAGLKSEDVSDLSIKIKESRSSELSPYEKEVMEAVEKALEGKERLLLTEFKDEIKSEPAFFAKRFTAFKEKVGTAVKARGWWSGAGLKPAIIATVVMVFGAALCVFIAVQSFDIAAGFPFATLFWALGAAVLGLNAFLLIIFMAFRRGWEKRSQDGAQKAAEWQAFRRFLTDFPGIPGAAPGSIAIWERFLVYGIAFGVADKVLAAAQLHAPPELTQSSNMYFISSGGQLGAGHSAFAIADISGAVASASPPSSGGAGGGGGFSGGGGFGGGGGGGGAW